MLRSTPSGRCGLCLGSSPLATRSVHSPKYLNGTPPSCPASRFTMLSPVWPDCDAAHPRLLARLELAERGRDRARRFLPELMAADAVDVTHALAPDRRA